MQTQLDFVSLVVWLTSRMEVQSLFRVLLLSWVYYNPASSTSQYPLRTNFSTWAYQRLCGHCKICCHCRNWFGGHPYEIQRRGQNTSVLEARVRTTRSA